MVSDLAEFVFTVSLTIPLENRPAMAATIIPNRTINPT
jgi:hypothetical protein